MATRRLYRSRKEKVIAGVCGGLAEYFGIDPVLVRLLMVLLFIYGVGLILYILAWIMIPQEPAEGVVEEVVETDEKEEKRKREKIGAAILITIGVVILLGEFYDTGFIWKLAVPITIIGAGIYILLRE